MHADIVQTIADQVGVSPRTVQRILTGELRDSRPTIVRRAERIRSLARSLNYRPNAAARAVRTGRFNNVALILATGEHRSPLGESLLRGVHDGLEVTGQHLLVARYSDAALTDQGVVPRVLTELTCDGLLINVHSAVPEDLPGLLDRFRVPSVWMNVKLVHDCVHPDDLGAGRLATEHLLELGHRRIAYMDARWHHSARRGERHYSKVDRYGGYEAAMRSAGLTPRPWFDDAAMEADPFGWIEARLRADDRPTAIVAYGYELDWVERVALRMGLRVPEDLSLVNFSGERLVGIAAARNTAVVVGLTDLGRLAVEVLSRKIADPASKVPAVVLPAGVSPGYSSGPAPPRPVDR